VTVEIKLFGNILPFSESELRYFPIRKTFCDLATKQCQEYKVRYFEKYSSLDDLIEHGFEDGLRTILPVATIAIEILTANGIYEFDEEYFAQMLFSKEPYWEDAFEKISDRFHKLVLEEKALDEYRVRRREGRGKWVGGGFGLQGAIKGAAMAGAINIASGAAHMVVNGIGKIFSAIGQSIEKGNILEAERKSETLVQAIWSTIYHGHILIIDLVNEAKKATYIEVLYTEQRNRKAEAIIRNLKSHPTSDEFQEKRLFSEAVLLCPYAKGLFEEMLKRFGDPHREIDVFSGLIGIDFKKIKDKIVLNSLKDVNASTKSEVEIALEKGKSLALHLGLSPEETSAIEPVA